MKDKLLQVKENEVVTTSRIVAEIFNKDHKSVLRKIESLISQMEDGAILRSPLLFEKSEYINEQNKKQPMYYINRDGFTLLAMSFTGKEALEWKLKYIEAFNRMEETIRSGGLIQDNRLEIARMILEAPDSKVQSIRDLYPEYFSNTPQVGSLEYVSDLNTSYIRWKDDTGVDKDWIGILPTLEIYNNYLRYCNDNRLLSMGKKVFYKTLEIDFGLIKKQKANGYRYFLTA